MTTGTTTRPNGRTHIDVRAIERELNELWKQLAESEEHQHGHSVTRTCVLNLIVVTAGQRAAERATEVVARLTARHPNRAIVVSAAPGAKKDLLDAWAQMHCIVPAPGRPKVCGEQITIEAHGPAVDRVPGTILPLLAPDVPVMLWWPRGEPFDDPRFTKFADMVDRVIVDSATFDVPEAGMARMAALLGLTRISDLSWSRLTPWRELIAQFFDVPAMVAHLAEITRVTVDYEQRPGGAADRDQALLLIGWLASRLGWRRDLDEAARGIPLDRAGGVTLRLVRPDAGEVSVELRPAVPKEDALDRLAAVVIESPRARFSVARDDESDCALARSEVAGMPPLARRVRLERLAEAALIGEELRLLGRDQTFEEALRFAAEVAG
jgi:glucose-6-phosphate dehydrogenase assembly protein OpcA